MSEMLDKIKDLIEQADGIEAEVTEAIPPLEEAVDKALYSLNEIILYGTYGRSGECAREAQEALDTIKILKEKYEEQNRMMDILTSKESNG